MSADRRLRLIATFEPETFDALVISSAVNVGYLTGFSGDDSALLLTPDRAVVVSDGRFATQLEQECPDLEPLIRPIGQPLYEGVGELAASIGVRRLGFESHVLTVDNFDVLGKAARKVDLVAVKGRVEALRMIKDQSEVIEIRRAIDIAERAFLDLRAWLRIGMTERAAADFLESALRSQGASGTGFPTIVAAGARSALPHARPTRGGRVEPDTPLLIDWGASSASSRPYQSDLTRVLTTGKVTLKFGSIYRVVLEAQQRAIAAIRPGVMARDVDAGARSVIEEAGYGRFFNHSVGHGIGLDVHEAPFLRHVVETRLQPGMVVTVEPGIYLPEWGGVRIEDDVLVTESGHEVLSTLAKSFESVVL